MILARFYSFFFADCSIDLSGRFVHMNHRDNPDQRSSSEKKNSIHSSQILNQQEQSIPIKQSDNHRPCLKHQVTDHPPDTGRLSSGRVSFAHANSTDGKLFSPSPLDSVEKKHRSDTFAKKAKELQLAELTYFKDHARDKEPMDE